MNGAGSLEKLWQIAALFVLPGALAYTARLLYEEVILTWSYGPQMLGFSLIHSLPVGFTIMFISWLVAHVVLAIFLIGLLMRREWHRNWLQWSAASLLILSIGLAYIPYSAWTFITLRVAGPGPSAAEHLISAATQNQEALVSLLLDKGTPIDATSERQVTALESACRAEKLTMSRYLLIRGANPSLAPTCQTLARLGLQIPTIKVPPIVDSRPKIEGVTIEVH